RLQDEPDYRWHGQIDFTDNGIDPASGTIRARAIVANSGGFLTSGMFGSMRSSSGRPVTALLVPDSAVLTDQAGKMVMTIGKNGRGHGSRPDRATDQWRRRHALHVAPVDGRRASDGHRHLQARHRSR